jgi:cytochrome c5
MNDNSTANTHVNGHAGPVSNSKQLLVSVGFSLILPLVVVITLVYFVISGNRPPVGAVDSERAVAERIQKVGKVETMSAAREPRGGEEVFKAVCSACHLTGAIGSPKFGDATIWGPRIKTGFAALWNSALKGKNAMPAQGGGAQSDLEVARAVAYMANAGGAKFDEPKAPAAAASAAK